MADNGKSREADLQARGCRSQATDCDDFVVAVAVAADTYFWDIVSSCLNEYIAVATFFFVNVHVLCYAAGDWKSWDTGYWQLDQAIIGNCATLLGY